MSEPVYIAQTFEPEHVASHDASYAWFQAQGVEAKKIGCTFPRYARSEDSKGLLFEAWIEQPTDQGPLRWSFEFKEGQSDG